MTAQKVAIDRSQGTLFPEQLDDYITEDNPVRVIDVFVDELDLSGRVRRTTGGSRELRAHQIGLD